MSKYCFKCGKLLDDRALYCSSCGIRQIDEDSIEAAKVDNVTLQQKYEMNNNGNNYSKTNKDKYTKNIVLSLLGVAIIWIFFLNGWNDNYNEFSEPEVAMPVSGIYQRFDTFETLAPLEIKTNEGSGNYFIKINSVSGATSMTIFINEGDTVNIDMPLGKYEILCANGDTWYGSKYLFGPDTSYSKLDDIFEFKLEGNSYLGHTLTLYEQVNGNLGEVQISESEWK